MKKYWIILAALLLTACQSVPERQVDIEGISYTKIGDQQAIVFDNRNEIKVIYGNTDTEVRFKFSNGRWTPNDPDFDWSVQLGTEYVGKLVIPLYKGFSFVLLRKDDKFPLTFNDGGRNPCITGANCPWPLSPLGVISAPLTAEEVVKLFPPD